MAKKRTRTPSDDKPRRNSSGRSKPAARHSAASGKNAARENHPVGGGPRRGGRLTPRRPRARRPR